MSKKLINGKILSIQLGREETRIVLVGKNSEILHGITVPTPAGAVEDGMIHDQEAISAMLKEALETPEFKGVRQAVFSLCTSQVILETATTPDLPKAKLEKLIQANADMYFPVDIQDYRLVWEVVDVRKNDSGAKEAAVQLWAVPNEMLRGYYQAANACGLSVAAIDYCGHSAATAVGATFARPAKPPKAKAPKAPKDPEAPQEPKPKKKIDWNAEITFGRKKKVEPEVPQNEEAGPREIPGTDMHILMDKELLGLTFVQKGQVVYQRFYRCGSDPTYQFGELAMMVEYFQNQEIGRGSEIRGYVSGPGSMDPEMVELLSGMVGIPLELFQSGMDQCWLLCAGAARTTLEFGNPDFNKAVRVRRTINTDLWQYAAILASGAALVAVVLMLLNSRLGWNSEISQLENTRDLLQIQSAQVNGFKENYDNYETEYAAYDRDWDALFNSLHTYNDNLVFVLEELENVMPANTSVTDIIIDSDSVMISFACDDKEEAAYLIMSLRDMEYVDVNTISNLIGGGKGAATDYGTPIEEVMPPTEGGTEEETQQETALPEETGNNGIAVAAEIGSTQDYLTALKTLESSEYAKIPDTKLDHTRFDALKAKHTGLTFEQRAAAMRSLIGTNPFAANHFVDLIKADYRSNTYGVVNYLLIYMNSHPEAMKDLQPLISLAMGGGDVVWEDIQKSLNTALDILTENEEILGKTEKLLCSETDHYMEMSYVHYLEVQMGIRSAQTHPYLNPEKVAPGGVTTVVDTENDALNEWVNAQLAKYQVPAAETAACSGCHVHNTAEPDNICDTCGGIIDEAACTHPEETRKNYTHKEGTSTHTYICGAEGCGLTITENCTDTAEPLCQCDRCSAEMHNIVFGQIAGTRTHAQSCTNCGEVTGDTEPCQDKDINELCDVCGGSVAYTRDEIEILEHIYGRTPAPNGKIPSTYGEYEDYLEENHPTYFEREAAIVNLFCKNAFAANDYFEDIAEIFKYNKDKIEVTEEFKSIQSVLDKVGQLLEINSVDDNNEKLSQIEKLIFEYDPTDDKYTHDGTTAKYDIKTAYMYYLEKAMIKETEDVPHLIAKDKVDAETEDDPDRILGTWDYVQGKHEMTVPRAPYGNKDSYYEDILYNYLASDSDKTAIKYKIGSEMVEDLDDYFEGKDAAWQSKYEAALRSDLNKDDGKLLDLIMKGFAVNYYNENDKNSSFKLYDVLDMLVKAYRNGKTDYAEKLLLALQLGEREAEIYKDKNQDTNIEQLQKDVEELKKQMEALQKSTGEEEEGAAGGGGGGYRDTRVFLDIGLLYTEELWDQELQRKGLDRSAKLPKLEVEVG